MMKRHIARHLEATAYHEAGHAVMTYLEGVPIHRVSIVPGTGNVGHVRHGRAGPTEAAILDHRRQAVVQRRLERRARIALAGYVAQRKFRPTSVRNHQWEADRRTVHDCVDVLSRWSPRCHLAYWRLLQIQTEDKLYAPQHWKMIKAVAKDLLKYRELKSVQILAAIFRANVATP